MDPKRIIEQGYDQLGSRYLGWTRSRGPSVREWFLDEVLQRLPADADVLELGCGPGTVSPVLADGRRYTPRSEIEPGEVNHLRSILAATDGWRWG